MNPKVLAGMFLGSMMAFMFCGLTMNAVGRAAGHMVEEVSRQFKDINTFMDELNALLKDKYTAKFRGAFAPTAARKAPLLCFWPDSVVY